MTHPYVNIAIEAARQGADLMTRHMAKLDTIPVERKARHDYVSEVDRACERAIIDSLRRRYRDHAFLGEETGASGDSDHVWIIDPLDGTTNFLRGIPHFAISIALQIRGRVEHAVVYDPMREEMYTASHGEGAFLNDRRIRVTGRETLDTAIVATAFPFRARRLMPAYRNMLDSVLEKVEDIRRAGAASLDLAYVACGRLDAYFELNLQPWDVAAGALLVREAGGVVMDVAGGDRWLESGHILAAPYKLITPLHHLIAPNVNEAIKARLAKAQLAAGAS